MRRIFLLAAALLLWAQPSTASEVLLKGSAVAMAQQNRVAREHGLSFLLSPAQVRRSLAAGDLVELRGNEDYEVATFVSWPFVVPAVRTFVETFSAVYRAACGQKLIVTSAVRPVSQQPRNAHALSVHPAGMAVDVRVSDSPACRRWIESELVALGELGVLSGIRERTPPHYHIAVYPMPFLAHLEDLRAEERAEEAARLFARQEAAAERAVAEAPPAQAAPAAETEQSPAPELIPLSVTTLMAVVGSGLVLGVRLPSPAAWRTLLRRVTGVLRRRDRAFSD